MFDIQGYYPLSIMIKSAGKNKEKLEKKNKQAGAIVKQGKENTRMKAKQKQKNFQKNFLQKH